MTAHPGRGARPGGDAGFAVILGSGLSGAADSFRCDERLPFADIPGVGAPGVPGHPGEIRRCRCGGRRLLLVCGRRHHYEGAGAAARVLVDTLAARGAARLLVTSAAGSLDPALRPGELVLLDGLIDLQFRPPAAAPKGLVGGPRGRAAPSSLALCPVLGREIAAAGRSAGVTLRRAVAASTAGPLYETPAEVEALQRAGAELATMSAAPEVEAGNHRGLKVAVLALVTNWAVTISRSPLGHGEVLQTGDRAVRELARLLARFMEDRPQGAGGAESG